MLSPVALKSEILRAARTLGFDDCRIAPIHRASHADVFEQWLDHGKYGDMAWMARQPERRTDPSLVLPGVQAMIVVAKNYHVEAPAPATFQAASDLPDAPPPAATGVIAKYAWGDDYHDLMQAQLRHLCDTLSAHGGVQKLYVDTGPILERDFASDAGLGWNGKSTVQIHPKLGTWFFLGEILTTLPVPPDQPFGDHCGKCTRCMTACPTQAITAPRQMDARRCLSYLTIEHKGSIPLEFRKPLGNRIYGCDDCLAVCPWNRFAQASKDKLPGAPLFTRADGSGWTKDSWKNVVRAAALAASLPTGVTLYTLRHSTITDLVHGGLDLLTVAQISGTSVAMIGWIENLVMSQPLRLRLRIQKD